MGYLLGSDCVRENEIALDRPIADGFEDDLWPGDRLVTVCGRCG